MEHALRGETLAPLATTSRNDGTPSNGTHTSTEAVLLGTTTGIGLESTLGHLNLFKIRGRTRVRRYDKYAMRQTSYINGIIDDDCFESWRSVLECLGIDSGWNRGGL